jgi:hypothetical protein
MPRPKRAPGGTPSAVRHKLSGVRKAGGIALGKYKVYVYAISKNEEAFVDRWMDSMARRTG